MPKFLLNFKDTKSCAADFKRYFLVRSNKIVSKKMTQNMEGIIGCLLAGHRFPKRKM